MRMPAERLKSGVGYLRRAVLEIIPFPAYPLSILIGWQKTTATERRHAVPGPRRRNEPRLFSGGLKVSLKPGEKAVCIGTVRYNHNEFLEITKASIVDDYERANAEFKKKFGSRYPPHKALLTPAK
jgi:hypothetical protein